MRMYSDDRRCTQIAPIVLLLAGWRGFDFSLRQHTYQHVSNSLTKIGMASWMVHESVTYRAFVFVPLLLFVHEEARTKALKPDRRRLQLPQTRIGASASVRLAFHCYRGKAQPLVHAHAEVEHSYSDIIRYPLSSADMAGETWKRQERAGRQRSSDLSVLKKIAVTVSLLGR